MVLAKLIQAAEIGETDRVLDVGCATGYSTMLLARIASFVVGLEEAEILAKQAAEILSSFGAANARIAVGTLAVGRPEGAPYDAILLQGSVEIVPPELFDQLKNGGRLAGVFGQAPGKAMLYRKVNGEVSGRPLFEAAAPALPGFARPPAFVF
jgi:protein-L-isoaspartate(D-aspartate) O-methyltransferase